LLCERWRSGHVSATESLRGLTMKVGDDDFAFRCDDDTTLRLRDGGSLSLRRCTTPMEVLSDGGWSDDGRWWRLKWWWALMEGESWFREWVRVEWRVQESVRGVEVSRVSESGVNILSILFLIKNNLSFTYEICL